MIFTSQVRQCSLTSSRKGRHSVARVSTYLNFMGNTEEAFEFYRTLFGTEYLGPIQRMGDVPGGADGPTLTEPEKQLIMHVELPILAGHVLMGTDMLRSMGHELAVGNNTTINLEPDTREETQRLFDALSQGASDCAPLADMFWGATWGTCLDRFGVRWMFNYMPTTE
jgi:PhnB protein